MNLQPLESLSYQTDTHVLSIFVLESEALLITRYARKTHIISRFLLTRSEYPVFKLWSIVDNDGNIEATIHNLPCEYLNVFLSLDHALDVCIETV